MKVTQNSVYIYIYLFIWFVSSDFKEFSCNFSDGTKYCLSQPAIVNIVYFVAMDGSLVS